MHGNAWEWCQDYWHGNYYESSPQQDPTGPSAVGERVARGGSFHNPPVVCRSAFRSRNISEGYHNHVGFRVVLTVPLPAGVRTARGE